MFNSRSNLTASSGMPEEYDDIHDSVREELESRPVFEPQTSRRTVIDCRQTDSITDADVLTSEYQPNHNVPRHILLPYKVTW
jgi:hypothetical protein